MPYSDVRLFSANGGLLTKFHGDPETGDYVLQTVFDEDSLLEANKGEANRFDERSRWGKAGFHKVASIPLVILMQHPELDATSPQYDEQALRKWLNDKDNQLFRTRPGRV